MSRVWRGVAVRFYVDGPALRGALRRGRPGEAGQPLPGRRPLRGHIHLDLTDPCAAFPPECGTGCAGDHVRTHGGQGRRDGPPVRVMDTRGRLPTDSGAPRHPPRLGGLPGSTRGRHEMAGRGRTPLTTQLRRTLAAHESAHRSGIPVDEVAGRGPGRGGPHSVRPRCRAHRRPRRGGWARRRGGGQPRAGRRGRAGRRRRGRRPGRPARCALAVAGQGHPRRRLRGVDPRAAAGAGRCATTSRATSSSTAARSSTPTTTRSATSPRSLGLSLDTVNGGSYAGWVDKYWIDGADYPYDAANADWGQVWLAVKNALQGGAVPADLRHVDTRRGRRARQHDGRPVAGRERARRSVEPVREADAVATRSRSTAWTRPSSRP